MPGRGVQRRRRRARAARHHRDRAASRPRRGAGEAPRSHQLTEPRVTLPRCPTTISTTIRTSVPMRVSSPSSGTRTATRRSSAPAPTRACTSRTVARCCPRATSRRPLVSENGEINNEAFAILPELMEQRRKDPQDDLITGLVHAEIDEDGVSRTLTLEEILGFVQPAVVGRDGDGGAAARLRGGDAGPASRPAPAAGRRSVADPERDRGAAALRGTVADPVTVGVPRRRAPRHRHPPRLEDGAAQRLRRPRRAPLREPGHVRRAPRHRPPPRVRVRHTLLHRCRAGPARRQGRARGRRCGASRPGTSTRAGSSACTPARSAATRRCPCGSAEWAHCRTSASAT